jgi:hypothetical protein
MDTQTAEKLTPPPAPNKEALAALEAEVERRKTVEVSAYQQAYTRSH